MGDLTITLGASVNSPLADGRTQEALHQWLDASKKEVADLAVTNLRSIKMDKSGRGTGHYQSEIRQSLTTFNDVLIDDPVIYGPWLEGFTERNESTRFKGYRLWRQTSQKIGAEAGDIAERKLEQYKSRIGIDS